MTVFSQDFRKLSDTDLRRRLEDLEEACRNYMTFAEHSAKECNAIRASQSLRLAEGAHDRHLVTMNALAKRMKGGKDSPFVKVHRVRYDENAMRLSRDISTLAGFEDMCSCKLIREKPAFRYKY